MRLPPEREPSILSLLFPFLVLLPILLVAALSFAQTSLSPPKWIGLNENRGGVNLRWFRVQGAVNYFVERRVGDEGEFEKVAKVKNPVFDDFNIVPGQVYFYRIVPLDKSDQRGTVSELRFMRLELPEPDQLGPPLWGRHQVRETGIALSWNHPEPDHVLAFNLYRKKEGEGSYSLVTSTVDTTYLDRNVSKGTRYFYVVTALSKKLQESDYSEVNQLSFVPEQSADPFSEKLARLKTLEEVVRRTSIVEEYRWEDYGFISPVDLAYEETEGRLFVSDAGTCLITAIGSSGEVIFQLGGKGKQPWQFERLLGIAVDRYGTVFGADAYSGDIVVFSSLGSYERRISLKEKVFQYFGQGLYSDYPWFRFGISDILVTGDGSMIIVDNPNGWLYLLNPEGTLTSVIGRKGGGPDQLHYPTFALLDRRNRLAVSDTLNSRVQLFDLAGKFLGTMGSKGLGVGQFLRPKGIALGPDGSFFVADSEHNVIQVFNENMEFVSLLGDERGLPIDLGSPNGLVYMEPDLLAVSEKLTRRIQVRSLAAINVEETGPPSINPASGKKIRSLPVVRKNSPETGND